MTKSLKLKKTTSAALKKASLKHLLKRFKNQSINKIHEHFPGKEKFTLGEFQQDEIMKVMKELPKNKASTFKDIGIKIMINLVHLYSYTFQLVCKKRKFS